jgi:hypothetical protein
MIRTDGTTQSTFQLGLGGPVLGSDVVASPPTQTTYDPALAINALDPTQSFVVPVRVGDPQQATDAVNLETLQEMLVGLGLRPSSKDPWSCGPGLFGGEPVSRFSAGATVYG